LFLKGGGRLLSHRIQNIIDLIIVLNQKEMKVRYMPMAFLHIVEIFLSRSWHADPERRLRKIRTGIFISSPHHFGIGPEEIFAGEIRSDLDCDRQPFSPVID